MAEITSFTWEMHRARRSSPVLSTVGPAEWTFQQSPDPSRSPGHTSTHVQILLNKMYLIVYSLIQGPEDFIRFVCYTWILPNIKERKWRILRCLIYLRWCGATSLAHLPTRPFSFSNLFPFQLLVSPPLFVFSTLLSSLPSCWILSDLTCSTESGHRFSTWVRGYNVLHQPMREQHLN